ncbi:MAG: hypothetical protein JNK94_09950 [Hyphomonadaceae bacterium]|nr:hypothetical protein [Hyphomonadaceae bacterium]MBX3511511.1 hypothetical protein [Hyphomonadaceae bacterium]
MSDYTDQTDREPDPRAEGVGSGDLLGMAAVAVFMATIGFATFYLATAFSG